MFVVGRKLCYYGPKSRLSPQGGRKGSEIAFTFAPQMGYNRTRKEIIDMAKTETIRARVEPTLKEGAEGILKKLGLSSTEAITLFYRQIILRRGLPFNVELPNKETAETLRKSRQREELHSYNNLEEFFDEMRK